MRARLDGRVTDYFEWRAAGHVETVYGAMHSAARLARDLFFGTDGRSLFVRVDPFEAGALDGTRVVVRTPFRPGDALTAVSGATEGDVATALDRILEIRAPLAARSGISRTGAQESPSNPEFRG